MTMNDDVRGKRLLLLGSSVWKDELRSIADEKGIHLVVGGNQASPLDDVADEVYRVDNIDNEAMKTFIRDQRFDGVFMGGSELIVSHASEYLNELGLPCYCTKEQWDAFADKSRFKALCRQFGLPVARVYEPDAQDIVFPVVTKPVDGSGGVGISVSHNFDELREGYDWAQTASRTGRVLVEQFLKNDSIKVFYAFSQGRPQYVTMATKYPVRFDRPETYVSTLYLFESRRAADFRRRYEERLFQLFSHLGLREGSLWIEVFTDGDDYCFNEAAYRYMGQVSLYPVDYLTGINQLAADITFALTGRSQLRGHRSLIGDGVPCKKHYCMYCPQLAEGRIARIEGLDICRQMPECVYMYISKTAGDEIVRPRTLFQVLGCIHLVFDTIDELRRLIGEVHHAIHVTDTEGREMLIETIDWERRNIMV